MKKIGIILFVLGVAIVSGSLAGKWLSAKKSPKTNSGVAQKIVNSTEKVATKTAPKFVWGVQCNTFSLYKQGELTNDQLTDQKIASLKRLGVKTVRVNLEAYAQKDASGATKIIPAEKANDYYINKLHDNGFAIFLVIDPNIPSALWDFDFAKEGYNIASYTAQRYKDKVQYFQVANEVTGTIVNINKTGRTGANFKDEFGLEYNQKVYKEVFDWTRGMQKGIRQYDPKAKIVLTGHWVLFEAIKRFIQDGSDFDIIGWSWYNGSDGESITKRPAPDGVHFVNIGEKLKSFGKDVWIVEANSSAGSYPRDGMTDSQAETKQAEFIGSFAKTVYDSGYFSGFFVYYLFDDPLTAKIAKNPELGKWGIIETTLQDDGSAKISREKKAFGVYQNVIKQFGEN